MMKKSLIPLFLIALAAIFIGLNIKLQTTGEYVTFDTCDSLTADNGDWYQGHPNDTSLTIDVNDKVEGEGCIALTMHAKRSTFVYKYLGDADLSTTPFMRFRLKATTDPNLVSIFVSIYAWNGSVYKGYRYETLNYVQDEWSTFVVDLRNSVSGSPDLTHISLLEFDWGYLRGEPPENNVMKIDWIEIAPEAGSVEPLTLDIFPASSTITLGSSASFAASAGGGVPPYSYSWTLNGESLGTTSSTITVTPSSAGTYTISCTVTDSTGTEASDTATLTVIESGGVTPTKYTLTVNVQGNGTTSPDIGTYTFDEGSTVHLEAIPAQGWQFSHWLINGQQLNESSITLTMDKNYEVVAYFIESETPNPPEYPPPLLEPPSEGAETEIWNQNLIVIVVLIIVTAVTIILMFSRREKK